MVHSLTHTSEVDFFSFDRWVDARKAKRPMKALQIVLFSPSQDLIVSILKVPILLLSNRIYQLIFVKVDNLSGV
jgi:hypothetical protein